MKRRPIYLRAVTGRRVTGRVLHLSVWAPDPPGTALFAGTGRYVPACGRQVAPDQWRRTGPDYPGWAGHAHWRICTACCATVLRLVDEALADTHPDREDTPL